MARPNVTLPYARKMLTIWRECEAQLATGQVQEYEIDNRRLRMLDMAEIRKQVTYWEDVVNQLSGITSGKRARRAIPRDL